MPHIGGGNTDRHIFFIKLLVYKFCSSLPVTTRGTQFVLNARTK